MVPEVVELDANQLQVQRIVSSKAFKTSEVHRNLLNYLAGKSLVGRGAEPQGIHRRPGRVRQAGLLRPAAGVGRADARRAAAAEADRVLPDRRPGGSGHGGPAERRFHPDVCAASRRGSGRAGTRRPAGPREGVHARDRARRVAPAGGRLRGVFRRPVVARREDGGHRRATAVDAGASAAVGPAAVVGSPADGHAVDRSVSRQRAGRRRRGEPRPA